MSIPNRIKRMPNTVAICIDTMEHGEMKGRLYDRYHEDAAHFDTLVGVLGRMEYLFDAIDYPQSSVHIRKFVPEEEVPEIRRGEEMRTVEEVLEPDGDVATFLITVTSRQNASWQGEIYWKESDVLKDLTVIWNCYHYWQQR